MHALLEFAARNELYFPGTQSMQSACFVAADVVNHLPFAQALQELTLEILFPSVTDGFPKNPEGHT